MLRIGLVGQPNCGKSTIFNHLVGYRAATSNLPGTTVEFLKSRTIINGIQAEVVDLPGTYSLTSLDRAEVETRNYILSEQVDVVINVVDASLLSRSLELTLQLMEIDIPLVLCLNMEDEARRKGILIDTEALQQQLQVPVKKTEAIHGIGVREVAAETVRFARNPIHTSPPTYGADVEAAIDNLVQALPQQLEHGVHSSPRLTAIKLLEGDRYFIGATEPYSPEVTAQAAHLQQELGKRRGMTGDEVLSAERHNKAMHLFELSAAVGHPSVGLRDRLDELLMHPLFGYVFFAGLMYGFFLLVFHIGASIETPMMDQFNNVTQLITDVFPQGGAISHILRGLLQGVAGAVGIVVPYLLPFLFGLALLEDVGYLPRAGYLMDVFMHKIGLHGKSVIPFILGYGCSVPAVMATRVLDSERDRFVTAALATMIPCVARTTIIYGLIGYYLGPHLAFLLYLVNIVVIGIAGKVLIQIFPRVTPGLILEIPSYKLPSLKVIVSKVWLRMREFIVIAWPLLIAGSVVISLLQYAHWDHYLNLLVRPITWALGLPLALGVTLIFGIFRKELSLVMLFQALGTTNVAAVLSAGQMMIFTLFVIFYVPCVATIAVLQREMGKAKTAIVIATTTGIALVVALTARLLIRIIP